MAIRILMKRRGISVFSTEYNIGRILELNDVPFDDIRKVGSSKLYKLICRFVLIKKNFYFTIRKISEKSLGGFLVSYNYADTDDGFREYAIVISCSRTCEQLLKIDESLTKKQVRLLEKMSIIED